MVQDRPLWDTHTTFKQGDLTASTKTHSFILDKYNLNQSRACSGKSNPVSQDRRTLCSIASNALLRSQKTAPTQAFLSSRHFTFFRNTQIAVSVEWLVWNPNCIGCKREWPLLRCSTSSLANHFSTILEIIRRMQILQIVWHFLFQIYKKGSPRPLSRLMRQLSV